MSFENNSSDRNISAKHSAPINIQPNGFRRRSASISSASSSSFGSQPEIFTPVSPSATARISIPSPATSPILSYFLAQSPSKTPATFPFKRAFGQPPVLEENEEMETPLTGHTRRASSGIADRFSSQQNTSHSEAQVERGTNLLRRLSLSAPFGKPNQRSASPPSPPPTSTVGPNAGNPENPPGRMRARRAATIGVARERTHRAPSPMGERILKGHFDGFN